MNYVGGWQADAAETERCVLDVISVDYRSIDTEQVAADSPAF